MAKTRLNTQKITKNLPRKINKITQKKKKFTATNKKIEIPIQSSPSSSSSSDSESEFEADPEKIRELLEPYSKDQLIDLIIDSAVSNPSLFAKIQEKADKDISHRKIFIHGLSWDTTNESLVSEFSKYGEIENSNVVLDRNTGKAKGYAFITYFSRESALNALKEPKKLIKNRIVNCQLAALGPPPLTVTQGGGQQQQQEQDGRVNGRKIYVTNVTSDVNPEKLRSFFAQFGEIESGPMGFDPNTGKFRGFALFSYKTLEGTKKALEEPNKLFEGRQLYCQKATEGKNIGGGAAGITVSMQPVPTVMPAMPSVSVQSVPPVMAAIQQQQPQVMGAIPTQNMGLLGQDSNLGVNAAGLLSALYGGLLMNTNVASGLLNLNSYGTLGQAAGVGYGMGMGFGAGGYSAGVGTQSYSAGVAAQRFSSLGNGSSLANQRPPGNGSAGANGVMQYGLLQAYSNRSIAPTSSSSTQAPGTFSQTSFLG